MQAPSPAPMNELETARAIASGSISSPQVVAGFALWAIRITSTGSAERVALNEKVWRPASVWLNDETLARISALPVICNHPDGPLTSEEYASRTVGTVQYAYIADGTGIENEIGPDIWAVCRIYDADMMTAMAENQLSTSPAVVFRKTDGNETIDLGDGSHLLLESNPSLLCHICLCTAGVWDKGGPPTGVRTDTQLSTQEPIGMTDEEKAAADKARQDAAGNIDKILAHLDSKFDAVNRRMDAFEEEKKADAAARKDAEEKRERDDAKSRRDAERAEWMKADAETCAKDDADEEKAREEMKSKGDPEEVAADKARKDRRDRMDARRKDAESEDSKKAKEDKARRDAEEKEREKAEREDSKARADSIMANQTELAARLAQMPMSPASPDYTAFADTQAVYDPVYRMLGKQAPPAMEGEIPIRYRSRLARGLQTHSPQWKGADLRSLSDDVLSIAEQTIRADAVTASRNADDVPDGTMMPVTHTNEHGHRITEFRGRSTIFKRMAQPAMRATKWHTERRA